MLSINTICVGWCTIFALIFFCVQKASIVDLSIADTFLKVALALLHTSSLVGGDLHAQIGSPEIQTHQEYWGVQKIIKRVGASFHGFVPCQTSTVRRLSVCTSSHMVATSSFHHGCNQLAQIVLYMNDKYEIQQKDRADKSVNLAVVIRGKQRDPNSDKL